MTTNEICAAINASPDMLALVPDTAALAGALSTGRTKLVSTEVGAGTILTVLGLAAGNSFLDVIYTSPDFRHVKPLIEQGRLDITLPLVQSTLETLVSAGVLTQAQSDALTNVARVDDPVSEFAVRCAIFADDGALLVGA